MRIDELDERALTGFERAVLEKLLAGENPVLETLRGQLDVCEVTSRESTGHGFFTNLDVNQSMSPAPTSVQRIRICDVGADIRGLKYGAGFVVFVTDGYLDCLEGFSYEEPWPPELVEYSLTYERERSRDPGAINLA